MATTLRGKIVDRIDVHIGMLEDSVQYSIKNVKDLSDSEVENVAYELKQIRDLKILKDNLREFTYFSQLTPTLRESLFDVIEEMMDLDI